MKHLPCQSFTFQCRQSLQCFNEKHGHQIHHGYILIWPHIIWAKFGEEHGNPSIDTHIIHAVIFKFGWKLNFTCREPWPCLVPGLGLLLIIAPQPDGLTTESDKLPCCSDSWGWSFLFLSVSVAQPHLLDPSLWQEGRMLHNKLSWLLNNQLWNVKYFILCRNYVPTSGFNDLQSQTKATLHSQMSICYSVCLQSKPLNFKPFSLSFKRN